VIDRTVEASLPLQRESLIQKERIVAATMAEPPEERPNEHDVNGDPNSTTLVWAKVWAVSAGPPRNTIKVRCLSTV
jgi:hypothetical protein